jgi:hypothetical protein
MGEKLPSATHIGELKIGDYTFPCAVLEDGRRVISENAITEAFGSTSGASKRIKKQSKDSGALTPLFLAPKRLEPFIPKALYEGPLTPITFTMKAQTMHWFAADLLPKVCEIWLEAREAGVLKTNQLKAKARNAEILIRGLAHIGIIALVDEATGYQEIRDKQALQKILDKYLLKERAKWAKRFPDEFYQEMFRLRGWAWKGMKINRPSVVGTYTNDIVYSRLAPGILDELKKLNPKTETGHRKAKHTQFFTEDIGHPALSQHIHTLIAFMRASGNWGQFHRTVTRAFPKLNEDIPLPFED